MRRCDLARNVRPDQERVEEGAARPSALRADDAVGEVRLHLKTAAARLDQRRRFNP